MSAADVAAIIDKAKELDQVRKEQEEALGEINRIHKKLQTAQDIGDKSGDVILQRLRSLYARAKELSENEVNASTTLINQLDALPQVGMSAAQRKKIEVSEQKKKRVKSDMDVTRVPSATIRNLDPTCLMGEQVAARVTDDGDKMEWIVVKVMNFDRETKEFELLDEDPGDDEEPKKYKLHMSHIIPFPKRGDLSNTPDYPPGKHVLAVYPGTTALYKATVVQDPRRKRKTDDYLLEFDDDEEEDGSLPHRTVPFHQVVPYPEGHRQ